MLFRFSVRTVTTTKTTVAGADHLVLACNSHQQDKTTAFYSLTSSFKYFRLPSSLFLLSFILRFVLKDHSESKLQEITIEGKSIETIDFQEPWCKLLTGSLYPYQDGCGLDRGNVLMFDPHHGCHSHWLRKGFRIKSRAAVHYVCGVYILLFIKTWIN